MLGLLAGCDATGMSNEDQGAILGGVIGGVAGSQVGDGDGNKAAIIGGTLIGSQVGKKVANLLMRQKNKLLLNIRKLIMLEIKRYIKKVSNSLSLEPL